MLVRVAPGSPALYMTATARLGRVSTRALRYIDDTAGSPAVALIDASIINSTLLDAKLHSGMYAAQAFCSMPLPGL